MYEISVVIPVRDEEENLGDLTSRIFASIKAMRKTFEIIFITDLNKDDTVGLLQKLSRKHPNVRALKLSNSFGQHVAVMAGLDHCRGKYIVIMDGDLQDLPEDIPLLYDKIRQGFDIVYAVKQNKNTDFFRNLSSRAFNVLMNRLSNIDMDSNSSMFRIISRRALEEVTRFREFEPSLTYIFSFINLPTTTVNVRSGQRQRGATKYSLLMLISFAMSSFVSFSRKPLRLISGFGLLMSVFSFIYFSIVIFQYLFRQIEILGWATTIAIITLTGGIQLLSLGMIGEYVGRMYMQTKNRPLYIIEKKYGKFGQEPAT